MKNYLFLVICFFIGVLLFYLLKQNCGCKVVEGQECNAADFSDLYGEDEYGNIFYRIFTDLGIMKRLASEPGAPPSMCVSIRKDGIPCQLDNDGKFVNSQECSIQDHCNSHWDELGTNTRMYFSDSDESEVYDEFYKKIPLTFVSEETCETDASCSSSEAKCINGACTYTAPFYDFVRADCQERTDTNKCLIKQYCKNNADSPSSTDNLANDLQDLFNKQMEIRNTRDQNEKEREEIIEELITLHNPNTSLTEVNSAIAMYSGMPNINNTNEYTILSDHYNNGNSILNQDNIDSITQPIIGNVCQVASDATREDVATSICSGVQTVGGCLLWSKFPEGSAVRCELNEQGLQHNNTNGICHDIGRDPINTDSKREILAEITDLSQDNLPHYNDHVHNFFDKLQDSICGRDDYLNFLTEPSQTNNNNQININQINTNTNSAQQMGCCVIQE